MSGEILEFCKKLDGTDDRTCGYKGPYALDRNRPSQARVVRGDYSDSSGPHSGIHLRCIPAEEFRYRQNHAENQNPSEKTPEFREVSFQKLATEQNDCTQFIKRSE